MRVALADLSAGERVLASAAARYLTVVHRLRAGARFVAFDPEARLEAEAEIVAAGSQLRVRLDPPRPARALPDRPVTVIYAASKGSKIDDVLRDATELGATRFVVALCQRSVKRPDAAALARWRRVAIEAARQCGRGDLPDVVGPIAFTDAIAGDEPIKLLLDPDGEPIARALAGKKGAAAIAVGPEGGFSDPERRAAAAAGYRAVALGPFTLRTETACAAALGALQALRE